MYKVVLKVKKLAINIQESVGVKLLLRKDKFYFFLPGTSQMINGHVQIDTYGQFYVRQDNPVFNVEVIVIMGEAKKFAGRLTINLAQWQINSFNRSVSSLKQSLDKKANIVFQFLFVRSQKKFQKKDLISSQQIQIDIKKRTQSEINEQNTFLMNQNSRLSSQLQDLIQKNQTLLQSRQLITKDFKFRQEENQKQISRKNQQIEKSYSELNKERKKLIEMIECINQQGQQELIQKIEASLKINFH